MSIHHRLFDLLSHLPHAAINSRHPLPSIHQKITSSTSKKLSRPPPKARSHSRGQERATASQDTHSTGAPRLRRSRTSGLLLLREKATKIGSLAPPPVASLINTQPTQRLHHQAMGPRGNIFAHPFGHHTFSSFRFVPSFYPFCYPRRSFPPSFHPARRKPTRRATYKHHQPGSPRFLTALTTSRAPPFF